MISSRRLKTGKIKELLDKKEKVRQARKNLEEATRESLKESQITRLRSWSKSSLLLLD